VRISKYFRVSSLADFISSRYGNSSLVGGIVAILCVVAVLPYIAIQLKAIGTGFNILVGNPLTPGSENIAGFYKDSNFYLTCILALFIIVFGTRNIETSTKNQGLVSVIAFEAIVKLVAFICVGVFVSFVLFDGLDDIFEQAARHSELQSLFSFSESQGNDWFPALALSFLAVLFLPRQFQTAVLENTSEQNLRTAVWLFPLYLLLINFFVLPIAIGGKLLMGNEVDPDTYVLSIPLVEQHTELAIFSYIGGFSASASMIMVSVFALTIMVSNNLIMPIVAKRGDQAAEISSLLIIIRRFGIVLIMLLAYLYYILIASKYSIVTTGVISFVGVVQLAPAAILGMYWRHGSRKGALSGIITGSAIWGYMLITPHLISLGWLPETLQTDGLLGLSILRPHGFLGLTEYSPEISCFIISLFINTIVYVFVSVFTRQEQIERIQADKFINIDNYLKKGDNQMYQSGEIAVEPIVDLLERVLGKAGADSALLTFKKNRNIENEALIANAQLVAYTETVLASAIGTASARILISSVVAKEDFTFDDLLGVAKESGELLSLNKRLKQQSEELKAATSELKKANERLLALDKEKDLFISTVTHELRTPITSIRSFCEILYDNEDLPRDEQTKFLEIIVRETERISRLITQVLDLEKLQSGASQLEIRNENISRLVEEAIASVRQAAIEKNLNLTCRTTEKEIFWNVNRDRLTQVMVNLLSNAIKYHDKVAGKIIADLVVTDGHLQITVSDNGPGMAEEFQEKVFEKFYQIRKKDNIKGKGVGLGLAISKSIVEKHQGKITIERASGGGTIVRIVLPEL
ncbi:MAG: ATP-binding protein, partial [Cyclobacteriaceae bacterium]